MDGKHLKAGFIVCFFCWWGNYGYQAFRQKTARLRRWRFVVSGNGDRMKYNPGRPVRVTDP